MNSSHSASVVAPLVLTVPAAEADASWRGTQCFAARLRACTTASESSQPLAAGVYAITGGLGGLGLRAAALLVDAGAAGVLLSSRSGRMGQGILTLPLTVIGCDIADSAEALGLLACAGCAGLDFRR